MASAAWFPHAFMTSSLASDANATYATSDGNDDGTTVGDDGVLGLISDAISDQDGNFSEDDDVIVGALSVEDYHHDRGASTARSEDARASDARAEPVVPGDTEPSVHQEKEKDEDDQEDPEQRPISSRRRRRRSGCRFPARSQRPSVNARQQVTSSTIRQRRILLSSLALELCPTRRSGILRVPNASGGD